MGGLVAACSSFCSPTVSETQIQPDTERMTNRSSNESSSGLKSKSFGTTTASRPSTTPTLDDDPSNDSSSDERKVTASIAPQTSPYNRRDLTKDNAVIEQFKDAVLHGHDSVVLALHEANPSMDLINVKFANGDNCLQTAVKHAQYNVIQYLLRAGVSPNQQNEDGETVLHLAVRLNDIRSATLLHKFGADTNITNNEGITAPDIAYRLRYDDLFDLLMSNVDGDLLGSVGLFAQSPTIEPLLAKLDANGSNPQSSMQGNDTDRLNEMTDDLLLEIDTEQEVKQRKIQLVPLKGWLSKKQTYSWSKRWVLVQDGYLLWSERQILPGDKGITSAEKKRWDHCFALDKIESVDVVSVDKDKSGRQFTIKIKDEKREKIWKAVDTESRDKWVNWLKQHVAVRRQELMLRADRNGK